MTPTIVSCAHCVHFQAHRPIGWPDRPTPRCDHYQKCKAEKPLTKYPEMFTAITGKVK